MRIFNVIDDRTREYLAIDSKLSYPARSVVQTLNNLKEALGAPKYVRCDNVPEFILKIFMSRSEKNFIEMKYIQPGKPMQKGYVERFNRFFRKDILDTYYFNDICQLQKTSDNWREDYNSFRPNSALGEMFLNEYIEMNENSPDSLVKTGT